EPDGTFLVPPNPAMFDERAAEVERVATNTRLAGVLAELVEQESRADIDQQLLSELRGWRSDCPQGRLAELADTFARLDERHAQEAVAADRLAHTAAALEQQLLADEQDYPKLQ